VPVVTRVAFRRAAPGIAQLLEAWPDIVGPGLGAVTTPRGLSRGTLSIGCSGPVAMELQHLSGELLDRINRYFGSPTVLRLRIAQTQTAPTAPPVRRHPSGATRQAAANAVSDLPDGPLRLALIELGQAVLSESPSRLGRQPRTRC
jgi:hypothetical protein